MGNQEIMLEPQDFEDALRDFKSLIDDYDKVYKKIVDSNIKLSAVFRGDAGNSFKTESAIVEKVFAKNIESLNIILQSRLQYALDNMTQTDLDIASKFINNPLVMTAENRPIVDIKSGTVERSETEVMYCYLSIYFY